jgi:hypothetical protein
MNRSNQERRPPLPAGLGSYCMNFTGCPLRSGGLPNAELNRPIHTFPNADVDASRSIAEHSLQRLIEFGGQFGHRRRSPRAHRIADDPIATARERGPWIAVSAASNVRSPSFASEATFRACWSPAASSGRCWRWCRRPGPWRFTPSGGPDSGGCGWAAIVSWRRALGQLSAKPASGRSDDHRPSVSMIRSAVSPPLKFCWPVTRFPSRIAKPFQSPAWM